MIYKVYMSNGQPLAIEASEVQTDPNTGVQLLDEEGNIVKCDQWALVNPRIVANAVKVAYLKNGEGCLSVPEDQPGIVPRSAKVTVKGYDALTDQEVTIVARGFTAICLQHELDHFEGILYYDHFNKEDPKAPIPNAMVIE